MRDLISEFGIGNAESSEKGKEAESSKWFKGGERRSEDKSVRRADEKMRG